MLLFHVADLPVKLGTRDGGDPTGDPVSDSATRWPRVRAKATCSSLSWVRLLDDGAPWLGADPSLAEVGTWLIDARRSVEQSRRGCLWLCMIPSVDSVTRLANLALDAATPEPVREQAIASLGYRQLRAMHPSTLWSVEAIAVADEALVKLADLATTAGKVASERLPVALRHVQWEGISAMFARAPGLWGDALECFASPALARVLLVCFEDIAPQHRMRVLRLIAAVLGEEAVPMLLARSTNAPIDEKLQMLFLVVALAGEGKLGVLEDTIKGMQASRQSGRDLASSADLLRQRARWHLQNRGVIPTVRGLRVARSTAVMPIADRVAKCGQAANDLGVLTKFARHPEPYLYTLWGWMVRGSADPARARELVAAHPESQRLVRDLYLADLARRGRVKQLTAAAQTLQSADLGAMHLAIWGRPFAALELAATARLHTPELVFARALACYRAGRPDLTQRILVEDLPPAEVVDDDKLPAFPGPHENWMIARAPEARPALAALATGKDGVLGLARPSPFDAEADTPSIEPLGAVVRRLGRVLPGSTVYLAGEFTNVDKGAVIAAVDKAGARLVNGPFPGTDFYVSGDVCATQTIAQLERQGARRLEVAELGI